METRHDAIITATFSLAIFPFAAIQELKEVEKLVVKRLFVIIFTACCSPHAEKPKTFSQMKILRRESAINYEEGVVCRLLSSLY